MGDQDPRGLPARPRVHWSIRRSVDGRACRRNRASSTCRFQALPPSFRYANRSPHLGQRGCLTRWPSGTTGVATRKRQASRMRGRRPLVGPRRPLELHVSSDTAFAKTRGIKPDASPSWQEHRTRGSDRRRPVRPSAVALSVFREVRGMLSLGPATRRRCHCLQLPHHQARRIRS